MKKKFPIIAAVTATTIMILREVLYNKSLKLVIHRDGMNFRAYKKKKVEYQSDKGDGEAWLLSQQLEDVSIRSNDDLKLVGHYFPCDNAKRTVLMMHGWRASWAGDFGNMAKVFHNMNCNLLLIEERAQGKSEGVYMGFGVLERYDCLSWVQYLNNRFGEDLPIYLAGVSMGAATVMMASELDLPDNVRGIIADCGFSDPFEIVAIVAKKNFKLSEHAVKCVDRRCRRKAHFSLRDSSAKEALTHCKVPVLFVHGTADTFVPCKMTEEDYAACASEKEVFYVEGAEHARSFVLAPKEYTEKVKEFFKW